jgi:hypothetical protein
MTCGGSHLGFPIGIKNRNFVEDLPMIIPGQFGFWIIETKLPRNDHWEVLYKLYVFYANQKSKMATTVGHRLTLDPMGKCSNAFFSETTNMIKAKLYVNVHWMVLEFHIGPKNLKFVEDHPMNIHVQFGFNHICSF